MLWRRRGRRSMFSNASSRSVCNSSPRVRSVFLLILPVMDTDVIWVFFCLVLVSAIESYRQQMGCEGDAASSDVPAPVLEEFVPINRSSTVEEEESSHENEAKSVKRPSVGPCGREQRGGGGGGGDGGGAGKSSENKTPHWMQSVQLSIRTPNSSDEVGLVASADRSAGFFLFFFFLRLNP